MWLVISCYVLSSEYNRESANLLDLSERSFNTGKYGHNCHKRDDRIKTVAGLKAKRRDSPNIDTDWQNWNEDSLDYEDENILEKRRQLLEKELAKEDSADEDKKFPKTSKR